MRGVARGKSSALEFVPLAQILALSCIGQGDPLSNTVTESRLM